MKIIQFVLLAAAANAFAPNGAGRTMKSTTSTSLHLFGGKKEGESKGPGLMDQMAMFKKAQEMASKKQKLDEELQKEKFEGESSDGKVKVSLQFVPVKNPMDPQPDYDATGFEFDDEFFESASPEELSKAVTESIMNGVAATNIAVAQKYQVLQKDFAEAMQQGKPSE